MDDAVEDRAQAELRRQRETAPNVTLAPTEVGRVDRDRRVPRIRRLPPARPCRATSPVLPDVDLEPATAVAIGGGHLLDRARRQRRQRVRQARSTGRAGDGQLARGSAMRVNPVGASTSGIGSALPNNAWSCRSPTRRAARAAGTGSGRTPRSWRSSSARPRRRRRCSRTRRRAAGAWRCAASRGCSQPWPSDACCRRARNGGSGGRSAACRAWRGDATATAAARPTAPGSTHAQICRRPVSPGASGSCSSSPTWTIAESPGDRGAAMVRLVAADLHRVMPSMANAAAVSAPAAAVITPRPTASGRSQ